MPKRLIVDGYNLIHADPGLKAVMEKDAEAARARLVEILIEHCARQDVEIELVFDAAGRDGPAATERPSESLSVTYTAKGESADAYIERLSCGTRQPGSAAVVTGDYDQQKVAGGAGMLRISSREFAIEMRTSREEAAREAKPASSSWKVSVRDRIPRDVLESLDELKRKNRK
ncbi:MAG: NYN domain-containing protein [Actinomycetota bacterium]